MIRVLQFSCEPLANGGQEAFIMNMYRNINRNEVQFDFFTPFYCSNETLDREIKDLGGNIYTGNGRFEVEANKRDFIKETKQFFRQNHYEIVHIHSGSIFSLAFGAKIAKTYGTKTVIVHSHATGIDNLKYKIIKIISTPIFLKYSDKYLACSDEAAKWKFPKKIIQNQKYEIIKNGIDIEKFKFNERNRKEYRKKLNIENDEFVLCNVGRIEKMKNQSFIINVFEKIIQKNIKAKLILVGEGSEKNNIINILNEKKLMDKCILLEKRNDVNNILQAADAFIFPSLYEGLGIVAIEAQTAGMKVYCSENIPDEASVTKNFIKLELNLGTENWANLIIKERNYLREDTSELIKRNGFDAKDSGKRLEEIYLENKL